ncbi:hypothetical protein VHARVF571_110147 [Vibrio harveyi]|nr:hypothetical protein VHARVF571_110147 [Vibrio harveyi]
MKMVAQLAKSSMPSKAVKAKPSLLSILKEKVALWATFFDRNCFMHYTQVILAELSVSRLLGYT